MISRFHCWLRFFLVAIPMVETLALVRARGSADLIPAHRTLHSFPVTIGDWQGRDLPINAETLETLGPGEFLFRDYRDVSGRTQVSLFIAYFASQRAGDTIHSPKNCLPGAGWEPLESTHIWIEGQRKHAVNRYVLANGPNRALVLYWYQAHGRVTPSEYSAKFYLVADSFRINRSDGALIRIIINLGDEEGIDAGEKTAVHFAEAIIPLLDDYIPR